MFKIDPKSSGNNLYIITEGTLSHEDYQEMIPKLEALSSQHGKLNCVIDVTGWEGWEWQAMWDDFMVGIKHFNDFGRIAVIGRDDQKWMEWFGKFYDLFRGEETRFFSNDQTDLAMKWGFTGEGAEGEAA